MKKAGIILSILVSVSISCKEEKKDSLPEAGSVTEVEFGKESAGASFSSERGDKIFNEYQELRTALVASEAETAGEVAGRLAGTLGDEQGELSAISNSIASSDDLEAQRALFSALTSAIEPLFRQALVGGEIYQQFCPMAFEGKGGYWISDKEEIRNPYYGSSMLTCGKVSEIIER